jgi:exodeoxyribonuclease VIII
MSQIVRNMPYADYAAARGINATILKTVDRYSLAHAKAQIEGRRVRESDALQFGKSFHALMNGETDFVVRPETYPAPATHEKVRKGLIKEGHPLPWNANATECKEWAAKHAGETIVTERQAGDLFGMSASVRNHPGLQGWLEGDSELAVFAQKDGIPLKAMIDRLPANEDAPVIDFKTCSNAEPSAFLKTALSLGYHIQAAFYLDVLRLVGIKRSSFALVAVETEAPYAVAILVFNDQAPSLLRVGRRRYRAALAKLTEAYRTDKWPDYGTTDAETHLPAWMLPELELTN